MDGSGEQKWEKREKRRFDVSHLGVKGEDSRIFASIISLPLVSSL